MSAFSRGTFKILIRILVIVLIVVIAVVFPSFDSIMAFMGSTLCFTICIILPLAFYLKIFGVDIPLKERILDWILIIICSIMAVIGTVWAILPKEMIGAQ
jgi:solute carrier family 32 (vesicular inhibitory amino acid transporter)